METGKGGSPARRCALTLAVAGAALMAVAAPAGAASKAVRPAAPRLGSHVAFGCANPANHGRSSGVLGAARVSVGGAVRCFSAALAHGRNEGPQVMAGPTGLGPSQIQSAYKLAGLSSGGKTVAIVDAYNDPKAASDLAKFRSTYGLPACTTANGCFKQVNEKGAASPLPSGDYGWAEEESLDLDAVSSACPDCKILLVEASSANTADLVAAEDTAAKATGVASVSNSWGGSEDSSILGEDTHFNHPGVAITASSGDNGYGVSWPASSQYVTGVGGTTLTTASNARGWSETAWSGAGSGCSAYEPKPAWQKDSGCAKRTVADVSAVADPNTGVAVYDSNCTGFNLYLGQCFAGWGVVGGTSASSPLVAAVYALAGNGSSVNYGSTPYSHPTSLNDVTTGSNGSCGGSYLCTGVPGYDGPTGLGTPNGTGAF
jgi:subtilase family serine protease